MTPPPPIITLFVIAPMIMKSGTCMKLHVFYTTATKSFVASLVLRNDDVITCILAIFCRFPGRSRDRSFVRSFSTGRDV